MADTFLNTTVFQTIEYTEIKAVCVTTLSARPDANNVNTLVKAYTPENLANLSLVELEKKGGPAEGSFLVEGHEVKYGISYARDDEGNLLRDDEGQLIVNENNGVLFGLTVGEALKKVTFNAIVVYGTEINAETNAPVVAVVSMFNNSLSFEKILNFFARYIITIDKELIELKFNYIDVYGKHEKETNSSTFYMEGQHPQILERVMLSSQGDVQTDELTQLQKQYELFIKDRDNYLYIKPVKDNKFDDDLLSTSIQAHQNARLYKYEDSTIKTPYLYFYYNLIATRRIILQGIKAATDNTEDAGAVEAITVEQLRKHIKLGFSETMGPFLYTWFSTTKFIYVICYGSNSNNNVDIYRVRNRGGYDINDVNYNLIVGKYLDRIYFAVEGDLHVCVPQVKTKTTESEIENDRFREEAKKTLTFHNFLYVDFDAMTDSEIEDAYKVVWDDINATNSATYLLTKEQLYILILSKNEEYKKFVTDGQFVYPPDEPYTPTDSSNKPTTANEFFEQGLFQPDVDGKSTIRIQDKKAVYQYLKYPIDRVNNFIAYIDKVTKECIAYKDDYGSESYKTPYVNQVSIALIERMRPDYLTDQNYAINWWGQNKQSGAKYSALLWTLKNGKEDNPQPSKYEDYIEYYLTEGNEGNIIDIILNADFREKVETELPVASDTFNVYMSGIVERLTTKDPTYTVDNVVVGYQEYFFKAIYKENDIISTETELLRFYKYSLYRALYDNVVSSSKSYQQYVLREYLVNEEKAGANNGDLIDKLNSMSIVEIDAYFDENKLSPLTNSMYDGAWWSETVLEQLEQLYLGVIETPLSITYAFGYKDDCYYNGEERKDVSIVKRDADIPYRYGFPLPNYIYNSQTSDIFIIPAKENVDIAGEYKSLTQMKEDLMIAQKDGEADSKAELDKLTTLTADVEVDTDADVFSLTNVTGTISEQEKDGYSDIAVYADSMNSFPTVGQADKYYYSKMDNSLYRYEGIDYLRINSYPSNGSIYQVGELYYKVTTKEQQVDYSVKVNNNEFTASNKTYKLKLLNITKTDTAATVDTTDNSTDDKITYTFVPPVANKTYTLSFMGLNGRTNIVIKQGAQELLNQKLNGATQFEVIPTTTDEVSITIENATADSLSVQYISSGNKRKITITETIQSFDPDVPDTTNTLLEKDITFTGATIAEEIVEVTATNGTVKVAIENGNIGSVEATYEDAFNKIEAWEGYTLPAEGTIAQSKDTKSYYKYDGATWTAITLQEIRNEYINKIYFVKDEDKYYRFGGMNWVAITPVYNIKKGNIYRITNENETINGEIILEKIGEYIGSLTGIRSNQLYDISLRGISMIDDREIVNVPVDINIDKYTFVPVDINIEYPIQITGINGNGKIILKKAEKVSEVEAKEKTANTEYTFTPPVSKKEYTVTITPLTQEAGSKVVVGVEEQPINDLSTLTIKVTPTNKNAITIKATNATIDKPMISYVEQEETQISEQDITDITELEIKYTPADTDTIIIEPQGIQCNTPTIAYIKNENHGLSRTLIIKQGTDVLKREVLTFASPDETFDKEYQITSKDETDITIEIEKANIEEGKASYSYIRQPDGAGLEYYIWNGAAFENAAVQIIPPQNSCKWYIEDLTVYFNIFIEGEKLNVIRDLFKGPDGEILKVVQFDFSDIGDVVLVRDYNKQGQNCWGGVFSRYSTSTEVDTTKKIYNYGSVMSNNFMDCFNWDAYNYIAFTFRADGTAYISDERIKAIQATYEVSRSHFEVLQHKFGDNMRFSNALTIAWEKSDEANYSHTMFVYPKNIKMFPNMMTMPYNGIRFLVNNYFIIEGNSWFDIIYNRCYRMNTGIQPRYYQNRFLSAMRSLVIVSVSDHDDEGGLNGAVSYFNCNNWYDKTKVTDYIEKVNIPQKDI